MDSTDAASRQPCARWPRALPFPWRWRSISTAAHGVTDRVEALGGRLEIQSRPGRGTTIHAWLPEG